MSAADASVPVVAPHPKPALPQQWADEIALASSVPTTASTSDDASIHTPPSAFSTATVPTTAPTVAAVPLALTALDTPPACTPVHTPPETLGGPVFDSQLDGFLDRFQQEIVAARALKDDFDRLTPTDPAYDARKAHFRVKMERIRALFATEGEDFVASLERRNPKLSMAACGENTIEFAQGIDRLEHAVREEEARRAQSRAAGQPAAAAAVAPVPAPVALIAPTAPVPAYAPAPRPVSTPPRMNEADAAAAAARPFAPGVPGMHPHGLSGHAHASPDRIVAPPVPPTGVGHALYNLSSDETLQLMQSDINALKLELMRIQRSKMTGGAGQGPLSVSPFSQSVPFSLPTRGGGGPRSGDGSFSFSSLSPDKENANPQLPFAAQQQQQPQSTGARAGLPPSLLANGNVNVVRVSGRAGGPPPVYASNFEHMKSRLEALEKRPFQKGSFQRRAKSAARLGRTNTMDSMYEHEAQDQQHARLRQLQQQHHEETLPYPNVAAMVTPPRANRRAKHRSLSTPQSGVSNSPIRETPPPMLPAPLPPMQTPSPPRGGIAARSPSSSPSPEHDAAAMAAQGPTPAKLFFDAPEEMLSRPQSHAAARDIQRYSLKVARRLLPVGGAPPQGGGERGDRGSGGAAEPRAKSVVTVSPSRQRALQADGGTGPKGGHGLHTLSELGTGLTKDGGAGGGNMVGPPSTIETTGSGGRVVEEIEGDMWVRKGVVWKRWRRRYASIVSHQFFGKVMCLFSYDSSGGVISTRSQIVVLHGSLCRAARERVDIGGTERYMFVLRTSSKEYFFAAESDEVRRNWIRELRDAAKLESWRPAPSKGRSMAFRRRG